MYFYKKVVFKLFNIFFKTNCTFIPEIGTYCTGMEIGFQFGKLLNLYKLRLRVRVLLMEVNEQQRSKEMRQSHENSRRHDLKLLDQSRRLFP